MRNLFKKLLLAFVVGFAVVGCGKTPDPTPTGKVVQDKTVDIAELKSIGAGKKIYVTTLGQAEFTLCKDLVTDAGVDFEESNELKAADVEKGAVVVVVIGYTGKGIAGNITQASEYERVDGFKTGAAAGDFKLISMFLGGKQRRGTNSDAFMESILPVSEIAIVWDANNGNGGNYDGKIPTFAGETKVYCYSDENDIVPSLEYMLK